MKIITLIKIYNTNELIYIPNELIYIPNENYNINKNL